MKWLRRLTALAMTVLALSLTGVAAYAHEVPDPSRTGTISVSMKYDGQQVPGGTVTLYRVGDVVSDNGDYLFALNDACADSGVSLDDLQSPDAAEALAAWVTSHDVAGTTVEVGADGTATFGDVALGLYVMVQNEPASGYYAIDPFLIGMPLTEDGAYVYDIDASPKLELQKKPVTPPTEEAAPETGDPAAPVAAFALCGAALVGVALVALRARR